MSVAIGNSSPPCTERLVFAIYDKVPFYPLAFCLVAIILGVLGAVGNGLSLFVIARINTRIYGMRGLKLQLILLSASEVIFTLSAAIYMSITTLAIHLRLCDDKPACGIALQPLFFLLDSSLTVRNWGVAIIALSRCDAVLRPLHSRSQRLLSRHRIKVVFGFVCVIGVGLSLSRNIHWHCPDVGPNRNSHTLFDITFGTVFLQIAFGFQRAIPTLIILLCTGVVIATLTCRRKDRNLSAGGTRTTISRTAAASSRRASRTVALLASVFILCEGWFFISVLSRQIISGTPDPITMSVNNSLVLVDSFFNILIYVASSPILRQAFARLCSKRPQRRPSFMQTVALFNSSRRCSQMPEL